MELVDTLVLEASAAKRKGSSPFLGTIKNEKLLLKMGDFLFSSEEKSLQFPHAISFRKIHHTTCLSPETWDYRWSCRTKSPHLRRKTTTKISWGRKVAIAHFLVTTRMWQNKYCPSDCKYTRCWFLSSLMSPLQERRRHQNYNKGSKKLQRRKTNNSFLGWDTSLE